MSKPTNTNKTLTPIIVVVLGGLLGLVSFYFDGKIQISLIRMVSGITLLIGSILSIFQRNH
jgi:uncharacterized membrane-anchored protein